MTGNMKPKTLLSVLAVSMAFVAFEATAMSQVQTSQTTATHAPSVATTVERGEVVYVSGNQLVVKMDDGTLRDFPNVSESAKVSVNGQMLGIHDLKPGMKLEKTITTTTTPKTITTVQTVTGKVWHVNAPSTVILSLQDGTNQSFKIPKGQEFMVNGKKTDVFGLRKGMMVSATKVVEEPMTEVAHDTKLMGSLPPPPPPDQPILIAIAVPVPAPAEAAAAAPEKELPKTGSPLPLIGLMGLLFLAGSFLLKVYRVKA
jgi:LPXTG-motif cell wall-anchored protein